MKFIRLRSSKKVSMTDITSKNPSREAKSALKRALKAAHSDQESIRIEARAIRAN